MTKSVTFSELVEKVEQQENTVAQLIKIVAATNHRMTEIQMKQKYTDEKGSI